MATDHRPLLADLRAEHADLASMVADADLSTPTPAEGWDVRDTLAHLAGTDGDAVRAVQDPDGFSAGLTEVAEDLEGFVQRQVAAARGLDRGTFLQAWQDGFEAMLAAFEPLDASSRIGWYGPPMSPASFVTARIMEYWAHGQDVADGLGVERVPTERLRHVAHIGVRARRFAYANRGLMAPAGEVAVAVTAPDGSTWRFGDPSATDTVTGTALDLCLVVTQRRHRDDTALVATGPLADEWLDLAQAFAGPPGAGRGRLRTDSGR